MESAPVVCREVFDENSQPSAEEISEYAQQIGIDPESESHLLPLARDGLMQALAPPWKAYYDESRSAHYYYNEETKSTQWEHPIDNVYRDLVRKARDSSTHDDTCASVQELNTYEENIKVLEHAETKIDSEDDAFSTDSENHSEAKLVRPGPPPQALLGRPPLAPIVRPFEKKLSDLRISPMRRSVDGSFSSKSNYSVVEKEFAKLQGKHKLFKQQSEIIDLNIHLLNSPDEENYNLLSSNQFERGLPLTGKGGMFIKNKNADLASPDTEQALPLDSITKRDLLKGILREKMFELNQKKSEPSGILKPYSFEEDRKSVRFQLESPQMDNTISPTSNSSSNDGQSSIISAPPNPPTQSLASPAHHHPPPAPSKLGPLTLTPLVPNIASNKILLSPLVARPPLPPRPPSSLDVVPAAKESNSASASDIENNETDNSNDRMSPKRRLLRPPAADYIKADLFKKNFHKISDLVKPGDVESLDEPDRPEVDIRPRSPMIPLKNKISINLMESIESETSIDSPDKEFANLDLNDMNDQSDLNTDRKSNKASKDTETSDGKENISISQGKENISISQGKENISISQGKENISISQSSNTSHNYSSKQNLSNAEPHLAKCRARTIPDLNEYRNNANQDEYTHHSRSDSVDCSKHSEAKQSSLLCKMSPAHGLSLELRSPRAEAAGGAAGCAGGAGAARAGWPGPGSTFHPSKPLHFKSSDSSSSLNQSSPKLDGVIISQGKSFNRGSDNVVVMYQFEKPPDENALLKKRPSLVPESPREVTTKTKAEEKRRLELAMYKEIEDMRADWAAKERQMRVEFQKDLRNNEEQFLEEKRIRLHEQADKHRKDLEKASQELDWEHKQALELASMEREKRLRHDAENIERQFRENLARLREEFSRKLEAERRALESESEKALSEQRDQFQLKLNYEKNRLVENTKAVLDTMHEEQTARVGDLRLDYRTEVERLRTQHACHVEELRARLASERAAASRRRGDDAALADKYRCLKEKYARLKHDVKLSIERRNKRREMSMTTGSETEKSNSHKGNQSLERCKEANEALSSGAAELEPARAHANNNLAGRYNDNDTSLSESQARRRDNNNDEWRARKGNNLASPEMSQNSSARAGPGARPPRRVAAVAFREPPRRRRDRDQDGAAATGQDSSDAATTADEKPKEPLNGHGRRRCFTRLKSASTSRLNYSPKRGEGWSSPLEALRQQLRKLDDLEDQFPDLACQPAYSLRYPFAELGEVPSADTPELEFVRHRALVEREGMRRARAVLRRRRAALRESRTAVAAHSAPSEERETTEMEVGLHRARALLGEKEIRLRHIERSLRRIAEAQPPIVVQECTSDGSSASEVEGQAAGAAGGGGGGGAGGGRAVAGGAVLRSLRALHADVRDIWLALDARRPGTASPETSSYNPASSPHPIHSLSAQEPTRADTPDGGVAERARGLRAWLHTTP